MTTTPEMVQVGMSGVPVWLWEELGLFSEDVLRRYFSRRGLQVYYSDGGSPRYLESVGVLAWERAIEVWSGAITQGQTVQGVLSKGRLSEALTELLNDELGLDPGAVWLDRDCPGPSVFIAAVWDVDWWRPELGMEVASEYEGAPAAERLREAVAAAGAMGARVMVGGTIYATDREPGPAFQLSAEGVVLEAASESAVAAVSELLGREPDPAVYGAPPFIAPDAAPAGPLTAWTWAFG